MNHKVHAVVGVLGDDTDPLVSVMKLEKAPTETYADIGGNFERQSCKSTYRDFEFLKNDLLRT